MSLPALATGVSAVVTLFAGAGVLATGSTDPASAVPAAPSSSVLATTETSTPPAAAAPVSAPTRPGCVMFCDEPGIDRTDTHSAPAPSSTGCRLFCGLERGPQGWGF